MTCTGVLVTWMYIRLYDRRSGSLICEYRICPILATLLIPISARSSKSSRLDFSSLAYAQVWKSWTTAYPRDTQMEICTSRVCLRIGVLACRSSNTIVSYVRSVEEDTSRAHPKCSKRVKSPPIRIMILILETHREAPYAIQIGPGRESAPATPSRGSNGR